ncbi:SHOCT domain-containing protein [Candidatus Woesearchaeota archaeon]|nr:SHOCT domain-containing protein [Candidatus Woesearchaeota archaeon]
MMGNYSSFFGFYGNIFIMLFWILIIILIMWIIIKLSKNNKKETSLEILKRRYAKGEINKKEFDKLKKDLM